MTEEQKQAFTREAEEKYPTDLPYLGPAARELLNLKRQAYIAGCSSMVERMEAIKIEIKMRSKAWQYGVGESEAGHFHECEYIFSIIDKHLNSKAS